MKRLSLLKNMFEFREKALLFAYFDIFGQLGYRCEKLNPRFYNWMSKEFSKIGDWDFDGKIQPIVPKSKEFDYQA